MGYAELVIHFYVLCQISGSSLCLGQSSDLYLYIYNIYTYVYMYTEQ